MMTTMRIATTAGSTLLYSALIASLFIHNARAANMEKECSIKLPGVHFTKCLNDADGKSTVAGDAVTIRAGAKQDYFNDPDGKLSNNTAPVLLAKVDNTKPFTFVAQVAPQFNDKYDAGALYLFVTEKLWQKFAFERDERGTTRIVSVRTIDTSDDANHDPVSDKATWLKLSSDTKTVGLYHSRDRKTWHLARLYKNSYPATVWLGLSAQAPVGNGSASTFTAPVLTKESVKDFRLGN
jgi:regulation of enolase protein 1 (concanavalin A-like superfamily)